MKSRIMYIELKSGLETNDTGPARIGRVTFSKTDRTLKYQGKEFQSLLGAGFCENYYDIATEERYWISGCKKSGGDRHWAGSGTIEIDDDVRVEYWSEIRKLPEHVAESQIR